jgi:hypothetical protein
MRVTNIDIVDLHYNGANKRHQGYVSMELHPARTGAPMQVQFLCHAAQPHDCPPSIVTHDLIKDALRQAHRMPGFRRGEQKIEVEISKAHIAPRTASA